MQYTDHYNLNLPEGSDIVNPLIQDNPNYTAIDNALYANKLRVIGNATETKTGTVHTITRLDTDIPAFKFVATGDFDIGDTFTVDGVTVTARISDGRTPKNKAFVINSTILCILDGTILNIMNVTSDTNASDINYDNSVSGLTADNVQDAIDEVLAVSKSYTYTELADIAVTDTNPATINKSGYKFLVAQLYASNTIVNNMILPANFTGNFVITAIDSISTGTFATVLSYVGSTSMTVSSHDQGGNWPASSIKIKLFGVK